MPRGITEVRRTRTSLGHSYRGTTGAERSLVVNGETITLDELGPIILQEDGRLGRLSNWHDMTEPEQEATLRFVAKRNAKRRQALLKAQAGDASDQSR